MSLALELVSNKSAIETPPSRRYISPAELIAANDLARRTFAEFMWNYVGTPDLAARRRGEQRPFIPVDTDEGTEWNIDKEMFTGYTGLGELVHIRVDPHFNDLPEGFLVAIGDLTTGTIDMPYISQIEKFYDAQLGLQTIIYFASEYDDVPPEYYPRVELSELTQRFTYFPGPHRPASLLRPIEQLHADASSGSSSQLGQRALTLVQGGRD